MFIVQLWTYEGGIRVKPKEISHLGTKILSSFFLSSILNITESVGDKIVGYEGSSTLVAEKLAISVVDVKPGEFDNFSFGVLSDLTGTNPEVAQLLLNAVWVKWRQFTSYKQFRLRSGVFFSMRTQHNSSIL